MAEILPFPKGKYRTILADPPWAYDQKPGRVASDAHYLTMTAKEICSLPVQTLADKDCILLLWATIPMLPEGLQVLSAWGFYYKQAIIWRKVGALGVGWWFRNSIEICLIGTRGHPAPFHLQRENFLQSQRQVHSRKPEALFTILDGVLPNPKIELFSRTIRTGWDYWGLETTNYEMPWWMEVPSE